MNRSRPADDGWRESLAAYVRRLNRMESGEPQALSDLVEDAAFLDQCGAKCRRLFSGWPERERPVRSETVCRPVWTIGRPGGPRVRIRLARRFVYEDGRVEERIEHETLDFAWRNGRWMIARLVPDVPERRESGGNRRTAAGMWPAGADPVPYINRDLLAVSAPASPGGPAVRTKSRAALPVPAHRRRGRAVRYDREAARAYADAWWNGANPKYRRFAVDCTNYVSQCLFAGGLPMDYTGRRDSGWWYEGYAGGAERWSFSWAVSHSLCLYMSVQSRPPRGAKKTDPRELAVGDVIFYDWDGDGRWQHTAIVTGHDREGWPLVNAHTGDSRRRYWDYRDSYAWSERTRYTFLHVPDEL